MLGWKCIPMKIHLNDIPDEGVDLAVQVPQDRWFHQLMKDAFAELLVPNGRARGQLRILRSERTIIISGDIVVELCPRCDRCMETFRDEVFIPIQEYLIPQSEREERRIADNQDLELDAEDLQFSTFKGQHLELGEILREQIVLDLPIQYLCREDCRGLCDHCGINLNNASCRCHEEHDANPFSALQSLSVK